MGHRRLTPLISAPPHLSAAASTELRKRPPCPVGVWGVGYNPTHPIPRRPVPGCGKSRLEER